MKENRQNKQAQAVTGTIHTTRGGLGFVMHPDFDDDIRIEQGDLNTALNGDAVEVHLLSQKSGQQPKGRITQIVKRAKKHFVGVVELEKGSYFLIPDDKRMYTNIEITDPHDIKTNDKVLVEIAEWNDPNKKPTGKISKIIGPRGDHEVEIQSILYCDDYFFQMLI